MRLHLAWVLWGQWSAGLVAMMRDNYRQADKQAVAILISGLASQGDNQGTLHQSCIIVGVHLLSQTSILSILNRTYWVIFFWLKEDFSCQFLFWSLLTFFRNHFCGSLPWLASVCELCGCDAWQGQGVWHACPADTKAPLQSIPASSNMQVSIPSSLSQIERGGNPMSAS